MLGFISLFFRDVLDLADESYIFIYASSTSATIHCDCIPCCELKKVEWVDTDLLNLKKNEACSSFRWILPTNGFGTKLNWDQTQWQIQSFWVQSAWQELNLIKFTFRYNTQTSSQFIRGCFSFLHGISSALALLNLNIVEKLRSKLLIRCRFQLFLLWNPISGSFVTKHDNFFVEF